MGKLKVYLDTNMIHDLFTTQAGALKSGVKPEKPKKFTFMLDHQEKFEFVTSFLTKAEIMRELVAGYGIESPTVEEFWLDFMGILKPKYIASFTFGEEIVSIVAKMRMKLRTMVNFFHIFIAREEQAYFVSGDKPAQETAKALKIYDKMLTYIEFQQLAASYTDPSSYEQ